MDPEYTKMLKRLDLEADDPDVITQEQFDQWLKDNYRIKCDPSQNSCDQSYLEVDGTMPVWMLYSYHTVDTVTTTYVVHFAVTRHPTDAWVAQQLREATPFGMQPRFLIRDRDGKFGELFRCVTKGRSMDVLLTPLRLVWSIRGFLLCSIFGRMSELASTGPATTLR